MADAYLTLAAPSEGSIREKMSKFIAFAHPVTTVDEAKEVIASYRKKYFDARHVCWAYMLGADRAISQSNDDGEPSGTAGRPILGQINSLGLTDVVVAVVRYFGGIKLGTSGLITAYKEAARQALEAADIVERHVMRRLSFTFPYQAMNDVMRIVKQPGINTLAQQFDNTCTMTVETRADDFPRLLARLTDTPGVTLPQ